MSKRVEVRRQQTAGGSKPPSNEKPSPLKGLKSIFVVGMMVWLSAAPSRAQEGAPPVLDPADVFTDAVEVVETLPILNADNDARMLWYFDPEANEWRGYAYPDSVEEIEHPYIVRRSNGTFIVGSSGRLTIDSQWYLTPLPEHSWLFDPKTEATTRPEAHCGRIKALAGEGEWLVYQNPEDSLYYLCFTETGDLSNPLPEAVQQRLCSPFGDLFWRLPALTADGSWLIFNECDTFAIYASDLTTGQTNYLGTLSDTNLSTFRIDQWLDETKLTIRASTFGPDFRNYVYLADLAQPNSLELIANQYSREPQFYDNPPRYLWDGNETLAYESLQRGSQEIYEYDLHTRERQVLIHQSCDDILHSNGIFSFCTPSIAIPNGSQFLAVLSAPRMGMIELVTVFELETGELIYEAAANNPSGFIWQDENTFSYHTYDMDKRQDITHLVTITSHGIMATTIERPNVFSYHTASPDGNIWLAADYNHGFSLYDPQQEELIPVLLEFDRELYDFRARWQDDGTLFISVTDISGYMSYGAWIVRIP